MKYFKPNEEKYFFSRPLEASSRKAFVASMTNIIDANKKHKNSFVHKVCKEHIYTISVVMYFPKNFFLVETFNKKISSLISSGIMKHLTDKYVDMRYWNIKPAKKQPQQMTIQHLQGVFMLWSICCLLTIFVFMFEVLFKCI